MTTQTTIIQPDNDTLYFPSEIAPKIGITLRGKLSCSLSATCISAPQDSHITSLFCKAESEAGSPGIGQLNSVEARL